MSAAPNFFRDPTPYQRVRIGGRDVKAALVLIDGAELKDVWNVVKGTATNHASAAYQGVALIEGVKLTFACGDGDGSSAAEDLDDLGELWTLLAPTATGKPPSLKIENPILTRIGLTAICRAGWKEYPTDTNGYHVELTVIQYAPPTAAPAGKQDPTKPAGSGAGGAVDPQIAALQAQRDKLAAQIAGV